MAGLHPVQDQTDKEDGWRKGGFTETTETEACELSLLSKRELAAKARDLGSDPERVQSALEEEDTKQLLVNLILLQMNEPHQAANQFLRKVKKRSVEEGKVTDEKASAGRDAANAPAAAASLEKKAAHVGCSGYWSEGCELCDCDSFDGMNLHDHVLRGIYSYGYEKPKSIVQCRGIAHLVAGHNVVLGARSGTGKTATFIVGILQCIEHGICDCQALVLVPTRERAHQVQAAVLALGEYSKVISHLCIGGGAGRAMRDDASHLQKGRQIIIGTPGRVLHLMKNDFLRLHELRILVVDEAEHMLSKKFEDDLTGVLKATRELDVHKHVTPNVSDACDTLCQEGQNPEGERLRSVEHRRSRPVQICLLSGILTPDVRCMVSKFIDQPIYIQGTQNQLTLNGIRQYYAKVEEDTKLELVSDLLHSAPIGQSIIYCSRMKANHVRFALGDYFKLSVIDADLDQNAYNLAMEQFREGSSQILLSTGLLPRSHDAKQVTHVINYDVPDNIDNYVLRIGSMGRFGKHVVSIILFDPTDMHLLQKLEQYYRTQIVPLPQCRGVS